MNRYLLFTVFTLLASLSAAHAAEALTAAASKIDRHVLVTRHNVELTQMERGSWLQVGNGEMAFGVDPTGLQTFAGLTLSHWGWHTTPLPAGLKPEDLRLEEYDTYGRKVGYATNRQGQEPLWNWLRENPHRMNLGKVSLRLDGKQVYIWMLTDIRQRLDLWSGVISSRYTLAEQPVTVETCAHPVRDMLAVRMDSPLVKQRRLSVELAFPYGDPGGSGAHWGKPEAHTTILQASQGNRAEFARQLDEDRFTVRMTWRAGAQLSEVKAHTYALEPGGDDAVLEFVCAFSQQPEATPVPGFSEVKAASTRHWPEFWNSGGAIDLSQSKDPRWKELERRLVLSQYLLAVNEAGSLPPQEAGLYCNGWNGKFHLEMHWWHAAHYALWDRWPMFDRSLGWYREILPVARKLAESQGYRGARWPKMVGPDGLDSPSPAGTLLVWQQPHPIFYAELDYRLHPSPATLEKWRDAVFATADFLADYAVFDAQSGCFVLGPPLVTMAENNNSRKTRNPTFELAHWRFGLRTALQWRKRMGLEPVANWQKVLEGLTPYPQADGLYLQWENARVFNNGSHPGQVGIYGMLPGDDRIDMAVMRATAKKTAEEWNWKDCWGWDYPMVAMAAARTGQPALAVEALLNPHEKNHYTAVGNNTGGGNAYYPANGGLLYAVALMAAGWDGGPDKPAPGFPDDGSWVVKWDRLKKSP